MINVEEKVQRITRKYEKRLVRLVERLGRDINKSNREYKSEIRKATKFPKRDNGEKNI